MARPLQASFANGEIDPLLRQRVDLALYQSALAACRNFVIRRTGGARTRPGTVFVAEAGEQSAASRFLRFVFSRYQAYLVEMAAGKAWFFYRGAPVTVGDPAATLADVTSDTENGIVAVAVGTTYFEVQTYIPHGWTTGRRVNIYGVTGTGAIDYLNGVHTITVVSASVFRVARPSGAAATWTSAATGRVAALATVTHPYSLAELARLRATQSADVMTQVNTAHPPRELRRTSASSFTHEEVEYDTGPFQRINTDESIKVHASATSGVVTVTATADIFTAAHVGALMRIEQEASTLQAWEPEDGISVGDKRRYGANSYQCVSTVGGNTGHTPPEHTRGREKDGSGSHGNWEYLHSGYGVVRITAYLTARTATAQVLSRLPEGAVGGATASAGPWTMTGDGSDITLSVTGATSDLATDYEVTLDGVILSPDEYTVNSTSDVLTFSVAPATGVAVSARQLSANKRTSYWSFGAWSEIQGYPGAVCYFGDRLVFGGTTVEPQRLDLSETGNYDRFRRSDPGVDSDGFDRRLGGKDQSTILDLLPASSLVILTSGGAQRLRGGDQDTVTPSNTGVKALDAVPAADVTGVLAGKGVLYLEGGGGRLWYLELDAAGNATSADISVKAAHLFASPGAGLDFQRLPDQVVWTHREDGRLLSLTHMPDQEVEAWALHDVGGAVEQVCVVPEGNREVVYLLVRREVNGATVRYIEKLSDRDQADRRDLVCVDCALTYDGRNIGADTVMLTVAGISNWDSDTSLTATFSGGISLTSGHIGREIWVYAGTRPVRCRITAVASALVATVIPDQLVPVALRTTATTAWGLAASRITGLDHLRGCTVAIQADGAVMESQAVDTSGGVTLEQQGVVVHVGLPFPDTYIETLPINYPGRESVRSRRKAIVDVAALVTEAQGLSAGIDRDHLDEWPGREPADEWDVPELYEGLIEVTVARTWEDSGKVQIWAPTAAPLTVLAVIPNVRDGQ